MKHLALLLLLALTSCGPIHVDASISWGDGISSKKQIEIEKRDEQDFAVLPAPPSP